MAEKKPWVTCQICGRRYQGVRDGKGWRPRKHNLSVRPVVYGTQKKVCRGSFLLCVEDSNEEKDNG